MKAAAKIIFRIFFFVTYILIFSAILYAVERTENEEPENHVTLQELWMDIRRKYNMTREEFDNVTRIIHQSQAPDTDKQTWTYENTVDFSVIMCTTIGYGNFTPKTHSGMILCIIGATFGIPLTLITLNSIGALITDCSTKVICIIETRLLKRTSVQSMEVKRLLFTLVLLTFTILTGACFATRVTGWSFTEGVYFIFITFSTIGFGDYVLEKDQIIKNQNRFVERLMRFGSMLFFLFGLALLASVVNSALELPRETIRCLYCPPCCTESRIGDNEKEEARSEKTPSFMLNDTKLETVST